MGIMGCYPDKRDIENELGGKWEKFYEYTFEDSHIESFEFPHDIDENESPLNLNGVIILISNEREKAISLGSLQLTINDTDILYGSSFSDGSSRYYCFKSVVKNGALETYNTRSNTERAIGSVNSSFNGLFVPSDSIKSFSFIATPQYTERTKIEFYVLRGV